MMKGTQADPLEMKRMQANPLEYRKDRRLSAVGGI